MRRTLAAATIAGLIASLSSPALAAPDTTPPTVTIDEPVSRSEGLRHIGAVLQVTATIADTNLQGWTLDYKLSSGSTWTSLATGTSALTRRDLAIVSTKGWAEGTYDLRLTATDTAGNTATDSVVVIVDPDHPAAVVTQVGDGLVVSGTIAVQGWVDSGSPRYTVSWGPFSLECWPEQDCYQETIFATANAAVLGGTLGTFNTTTLPDGNYWWMVKAFNTLTNDFTLAGRTAYVDNLTPAAALTAPAAGETVSGTIAITGTASDGNLTNWSIGYGSTTLLTGTTAVTADTFGTWDSTTVADGNYILWLRATDRSGKIQQTQVSITVDNLPGEDPGNDPEPPGPPAPPAPPAPAPQEPQIPLAEITVPEMERFERPVGGSLPLEFTVKDADSVHFWLVGGGQPSRQLEGPVLDTTTLPDGQYTLQIAATNAGGTAIVEVPLHVDNTPPALKGKPEAAPAWVTSPGALLTASLQSPDAVRGELLLLDADGKAVLSVTTASPANATLELAVPGSLPDGQYRLVLRAFDAAGNQTEQELQTVGVQQTPPSAPALRPTPAVARNQVSLSWEPGTSSQGVARYRILRSVNGGAFEPVGESAATSWTDTAPPAGSVRYQVVLESPAGLTATAESAPVLVRNGLPAPALQELPAVTAERSISLRWTAAAPDALYDLYRTGPDGTVRVAADLTTTTFTDIAGGTVTYSYTVRAHDAAGNESLSSPVTVAVLPALPGDQPVYLSVNGSFLRTGGFVRDGVTWAPLQALLQALGASSAPEGAVTTDGQGNVRVRELAEALGFQVRWTGQHSIVEIAR